MITVMTNKHKRRSKKHKQSNQSATDENEDDSFGDRSLDMSHDMSDGPDSGQPDEQSVTDGAATGTDVKGGGGKNDFESFVRTALTSMQKTMKKKTTVLD